MARTATPETTTVTPENTTFDWNRFNLANVDFSRFELPEFDWAKLEDYDVAAELDQIEEFVNARLDRFQDVLPTPVDTMFRFQRALGETGYAMARTATISVADATIAVAKQAQTSTEWLFNSIKREGASVADDATRMAKATQTTMTDVAKKVNETTNAVAQDIEKLATEVETYENWTKEELYDRAQELDIQGRSAMSKDELVDAIRNH